MSGVKGRSGGKPKPTKLKLLAGNPGKRPLNENEPQPKAGQPQIPSFLSGEARKWWRWYFKTQDQEVVTQVDMPILARWCEEWAQYVSSPRDYPTSRMARIAALEAELGIGPASRSRISLGDKKSDNRDEEFFGTGLRAVK